VHSVGGQAYPECEWGFAHPASETETLSVCLTAPGRQFERLERDKTMTLEALGLFVRAWLTATPSLADSAQATAQAKGRERYASFIETLGRRMQAGMSLSKEVVENRGEQQIGSEKPL
jgi:hypothetical protein